MKSGLQWTGHGERMADDRLPKRAAELCEQDRRSRRRRGRPRLRWKDCVKRDVGKGGEEEAHFIVHRAHINMGIR